MRKFLRIVNRAISAILNHLPDFLAIPLSRARQKLYIWFKHEYLGSLAKQHKIRLGRPLRILEVGAFEGGGTTTLARHGKVLTVDIWEDDRVKKVFMQRIRNKNIRYIQEDSTKCLPKIQEKFDFIFIDGSHRYAETVSDIENAKRLVVNGGVVMGDDLELTIREVDRDALWEIRETDTAVDPKTGVWCHPGVTLAVADQFGDWVKKMPHTLWAVKKSGSKFVNAFDT